VGAVNCTRGFPDFLAYQPVKRFPTQTLVFSHLYMHMTLNCNVLSELLVSAGT
jgi:hypothetical protein